MALTFELLFQKPEAHGALIHDLAWRPGHRELLGYWENAWHLFTPDGERRLLARAEDFDAASANDILSLTWSRDGQALVISLKNGVVLFDVEQRSSRRLVRGETRQALLSPDGKRLAFVHGNELYVVQTDQGEPRRLTFDGEPQVIWNGCTDWVYWEEIWHRRNAGFWWSPDSQRLAFYHLDDSAVPVYPMVDTRPLHPRTDSQRYPKAGDPVPRVALRVVDVATGATQSLNTHNPGDDVYLARVHWHPDNQHVAVERLNRDQNRLELLLCGLDGSQKELACQESSTWVNLNEDFRFFNNGDFLWSTEEEGWRHLYLYSVNKRSAGKRRRLTPDGWCLDALVSFDNDGNDGFVVQAYRTDALGAAERHLLHLRLDREDGAARLLTEKAGHHQAVLGNNGIVDSGLWVEIHSRSNVFTAQTIRDLDNDTVAFRLPRQEPTYDIAELPPVEHFTIPSSRGPLPAQLIRPQNANGPCPVIMHCYGGPGSQVVADQWHPFGRILWHRALAERGYAVLFVDNAASRFFGKAGEDRMFRNFGELELESQLAGIDFLRGESWADADRVGLWGWSAGGTTTLYCLLNSPGTWKAGVAGAPVTDWRLYDAIWIERYLGLPQRNEDAYQRAAPMTWAQNLADPLLLVHGLADDNVHPQNTFNMAEAFIEAGVHFDLAVYPTANHSVQSLTNVGRRHLYEKLTMFFETHLGLP